MELALVVILAISAATAALAAIFGNPIMWLAVGQIGHILENTATAEQMQKAAQEQARQYSAHRYPAD